MNGLSAYWLCLTLVGRHDAAFVGALAVAFAPFHASQVPHVQTRALFWMPVALVGLHRYWQTGQWRWLACLTAGVVLNGLTCGYFLLYFSVLLGVAILWLTIATRDLTKICITSPRRLTVALGDLVVRASGRFARSKQNGNCGVAPRRSKA